MREDKYFKLSMAVSTVLMIFLMLFLMSSITTVVLSAMDNDSITMNVTVGNSAPNVSSMVFDDDDGNTATITLTANGTQEVTCNGTVTDKNGYEDVETYGKVNATFYHNSSSSVDAANDKNVHYTNSSCTLFTGGSGNTTDITCGINLEHEALNGTWICRITAYDNSSDTGNDTDINVINQLIALSILNESVSFGNMNVGEATGDGSAAGINITNQGNVVIDLQAKANGDMTCDGSGSLNIGPNNITFAMGNLGYANGVKLNNDLSLANLNTFDLGIEGMGAPFGEDEEATNLTYWGINIPGEVSGVCN
ncbi:MAG: hypothetical protein U9Q22_07980, partial [Candidatus Altiarchaeota archaeon]|nr:hypothetical protein [Candidatus Altiarchaeota archaeon]